VRTLLLALSIVAVTGCSGARSNVRADHSDYPISLSDELRAADGKVVPGAQLESVGVFQLSYKAWSALMTLIPLSNRNRDVSPEVNEQVKKAGGDAVVGMEIATRQCSWNFFTFLGILPGCSNVEIKGNIVKLKGTAPSM
jgi:hypothetical protein